MNKKFFTLLVAFLATISFGAFAQTTITPTAYSGSWGKTQYYLGDVTTGFLAMDMTGTSPRLVWKTPAEVGIVANANIAMSQVQLASWTVEVTTDPGTLVPKYKFRNVYTGVYLSLDSSKAKDVPTGAVVAEDGVDNLTGDIDQFMPVNSKSTADINGTQFYVATGDVNIYLGIQLGADATAGVSVPFLQRRKITEAAQPLNGFLTLIAYKIAGTLTLSPNDLNTLFGTAGEPAGPGTTNLVATMDNYFNLTVDPENTQPSPFTHTLQARAVDRWEIKYGKTGDETDYTGPTDANYPFDEYDVATNGVNGSTFHSMYPLGTKKNSGKSQANIKDAVSDTDATWYALYSKDADAYVVVDTMYYDGTGQVENGRIQIGTDKLYNAKNETRYRYPNSYLFQFTYNAGNNTVSVKSAGYVENRGKDQRVVGTTDNSDYYRAYTTVAPMRDGSTWPTKSGYDIPGTAGGGVVHVQTPSGLPTNAGATADLGRVNLTYAKLVGETVYTLGVTQEDDFKVFLGTARDYVAKYIPTGVYTLKVASSNDATRVGKYLKYTLNGEFEYIEQARRQNFKEMPSAQWVITTTGTTTSPSSTFINREFENNLNANVTVSQPFTVNGASSQFFFWGGDTYEYEKVDGTDPYMGYKYVQNPEFDLNRYEFRYLHELQMNKAINTKSDRDSAVWVDANEGVVTFSLVKVADDTYGYHINKNNNVVQLQRAVYKVRVHQAQNFEVINRYLAYDKAERKYYLTSEDNASAFLLKENNEVEGAAARADGATPYYILLEANVAYNVMLATVKDDATDYNNFTNAVLNVVVDNELTTSAVKFVSTDAANNATRGYFYATQQKDTDENGLEIMTWQPKALVGVTPVGGVFAPTETEEDFAKFLEDNYLTIEDYRAKVERGNIRFLANVAGTEAYVYWMGQNPDYALSKVAVDNNTLDLVNGVIADSNNREVNNSAFSIAPAATKLYRTLGIEEGEAYDVNVVKFFRVNSVPVAKEYLYEDANSVYSQGLGMNFLGVEGKGMDKLSAMRARYFTGDVMPQYLISVDESEIPDTEAKLCDICGEPDCEHSTPKVDGYIQGRFLVNLIDSVTYYGGPTAEKGQKFAWEKNYTRLAFVDGRLTKDSVLFITNYANSVNRYDLKVNKHTPVLFQFRLLADDSNDFLFESESWSGNKAFDGGIAPNETNGGWIKIQNGVPVIISNRAEAYNQAEIFNLEVTTDNPTSNEGIEAGEVKVIAGTGTVTIKGAAGKQVVVANILGQVVSNQVLTSDEATIAAPAGVVVVSVDGAATKALVK